MLDDPSRFLPATLLAEGSLPIPFPIAVILFFAGLASYAAVNAIEIAVVASNRMRVRAAAGAGSRRALALDKLKGEQETFFGVIVILQNVSVFLVSTAGTVVAVDLFGNWGFLFSLVAIPLISTEFGEYTPKVVASRAAERLALLVAVPVQAFVVVMRPLITALAVVPNALSRGGVTQTVTEAELRMLIDIGAEEQVIGEGEAELLDRVFHFHDRRVNEIMVPRTEVVLLEQDAPLSEFYETFHESPRTRFPVYDDTIDNVVGIINIKDVLLALSSGELAADASIKSLVRPVAYIPETKLASELFYELQEQRQQMAVVVDEYGGVAGIVTLELLLEEMFGSVTDELGNPAREFHEIDENTTRVDGGMSIYDVKDELEVDLPDGDYETVAGLVLEKLGHIPRQGETVLLNGYRLTVADVKGVKIESVLITKL
jgi:putative hemolysin